MSSEDKIIDGHEAGKSTMEAEVTDSMHKVFGAPENESAQEAKNLPTPDQDDESTPDQSDESTPPAEAADGADSEPADENDGAEPAGEEEPEAPPALSAAERRAALNAGWSAEDLDDLAESNPGMAKSAAASALKAMNSATAIFSRIGAQVTPNPEPAPKPEPEPKHAAIDLSALRDDYGDDPIFPVLQQLAQQNADLAARLERAPAPVTDADREVITAAEQQEVDAIGQQIDGFFNSPDVTAYAEIYGDASKDKSWDTLTNAQTRARMRVIENANLIIKGAKQQGIDMPLVEAFERAHLADVAPLQEKRALAKIAATAQKRQKGFTLKPSATKKPAGGKPTQAQVESEIAEKMAAVFG